MVASETADWSASSVSLTPGALPTNVRIDLLYTYAMYVRIRLHSMDVRLQQIKGRGWSRAWQTGRKLGRCTHLVSQQSVPSKSARAWIEREGRHTTYTHVQAHTRQEKERSGLAAGRPTHRLAPFRSPRVLLEEAQRVEQLRLPWNRCPWNRARDTIAEHVTLQPST